MSHGHTKPQRASNCAHRTATVIEQQVQKKLPTLVLQLQQQASSLQKSLNHDRHKQKQLSSPPNHELEKHITSNLENLKCELMNNIDEFHQMVLSAKPNPAKQKEDPEGYRIHLEQYQEFLKLANEIVKRMQDSFNDIISCYREYIDQLWVAISQGQDLRPLRQQFEQHMQQNMARYWQPIFDRADQLIGEIELNFNPQHSARPMPALQNIKLK